MDTVRFQKILDEILCKISSTLGAKAGEYAKDGDRLHNFNRAMQMRGKGTREDALVGMMLKHWVSVLDIVDMVGKKNFSIAHVDEKIIDSINYLILLRAMLEEDLMFDLDKALNDINDLVKLEEPPAKANKMVFKRKR